MMGGSEGWGMGWGMGGFAEIHDPYYSANEPHASVG